MPSGSPLYCAEPAPTLAWAWARGWAKPAATGAVMRAVAGCAVQWPDEQQVRWRRLAIVLVSQMYVLSLGMDVRRRLKDSDVAKLVDGHEGRAREPLKKIVVDAIRRQGKD